MKTFNTNENEDNSIDFQPNGLSRDPRRWYLLYPLVSPSHRWYPTEVVSLSCTTGCPRSPLCLFRALRPSVGLVRWPVTHNPYPSPYNSGVLVKFLFTVKVTYLLVYLQLIGQVPVCEWSHFGYSVTPSESDLWCRNSCECI